MAAAGGIEAIVSAMKQHKDNANIQHHGCATIGNLANRQTGMLRALDAQIEASHAIEVLVEAMRLHSDTVDVVWSSCDAFVNLAEQDASSKVRVNLCNSSLFNIHISVY